MHDDFDMIVAEPVPLPEKVMNVDLPVVFKQLLRGGKQKEQRLKAQEREAEKAQRKFLLGLLEVADALDRILQRKPPANAERAVKRQYRSIESTRRLLAKQLKKVGVSKIELIGKPLDPAVADIEDDEEDPDLPDETVISEIVSAYRWHDGILRRAKVIVSSDE